MATIVQILPRRWPGRIWSIQGDDYSTLDWKGTEANPEELKPLEVDIRAQSDSVDAEIVVEQRKQRQQDALEQDNPFDSILLGFEILVDAVFELGTKLKAASLTSPLDPTIVSRMQAMRTRIQQLRSIT